MLRCVGNDKLLLFCAALGGLLFGYDTAIVNAALFQLKDHFGFDVDSVAGGAVVSLGVLGAFFGAAGAGVVADRFGRRRALIIADLCFIAGSFMLAFAFALWFLFLGRLVLGLGVGAASVVVPVYLAEMSNAAVRGRVVTLNNIFLTGGQFVASVIGAAFVVWTSKAVGWRIMFGLGAAPALLQLATLALFLPETARWLETRGQHDAARAVSEKFGLSTVTAGDLAGDDRCDHEEDTVGLVDGGGDAFFSRELFTPDMRARLLVGCGLQIFQQLSGINTIMYYSASILSDAGIEGDTAPVIWSMPLAFTNAFATSIGLFTVDRWGRRMTLVVSLTGCLAATVAVSMTGYANAFGSLAQDVMGKLFLVELFVYLAFFAPGMGAMPWVVNSEIYPVRLRSAAAAVAAMANWLSNAAVSQVFPLLMDAVGPGPTFALITACVAAAIAFVLLRVPETKGKTLEEIEAAL